jgi:hypothetical protein
VKKVPFWEAKMPHLQNEKVFLEWTPSFSGKKAPFLQ